jgi:hypothetical protein
VIEDFIANLERCSTTNRTSNRWRYLTMVSRPFADILPK